MTTTNENDFSSLPPSYDDVVAAGSSMLVRGRVGRPVQFPPPSSFPVIPENEVASDAPLPSAPPRNQSRTPRVSTSSTPRRPSEQRTSVQHRSLPVVREVREQSLVDQLALFSVPNLMLTGLTLPNINVELDTEAHLPNRRKAVQQARSISRIKYSCACFWFLGFILLFLMIGVPVAMLLTAFLGMSDCPYNSNALSTILLSLGALLVINVILRLVISALTCCKIADINGAENSQKFSLCVIAMELLFVFLLVIFLLGLFGSTWYVFAVSPRETPSSDTDNEYCSKGFYSAASTFVGCNLGLTVFLVLYLSVLAVFYIIFRERLTSPRPKAPRQTGRGY